MLAKKKHRKAFKGQALRKWALEKKGGPQEGKKRE